MDARAGPPVPPAARSTLRWQARSPAVVIAIGVIVLIAWAFAPQAMVSLMQGMSAMQPITALCLIVAAIVVQGILQSGAPRRWVLGGVPLALVGAVTLYQYATGIDLGIDRLLFPDAVDMQTATQDFPGRMAELSAALLVVLALVMLLVALGGRFAGLAFWLATAGVAACGIVLAGYIAGSAVFRAMGLHVEMALPTAVSLAILLGTLASQTTPYPIRDGGVAQLTQRMIAALVPVRRSPLWLRLAIAVALPFAGLGIRALIGAMEMQSPMSQFVPVVVMSAFLLGPGAGAITVITCTLLGRMLFAPIGSLAVASSRAEILLLLFLFTFLIVVTAIDMLFATLDKLQADADAMRQQARLIDQSQDAILAWERDGGIVHWSRGAERLYGYSTAEAMGRSSHELLATHSVELLGEIAATLAGKGSWQGNLVHRTREGRRVTVESRQTQVTGANGRPVVLESNRDLTAKRAAERRAADMELRLAAIVDALPIGIVVCEAPSGRIVLANRAVEAIFRHPVLPTPDLAAHGDWEAYHADGRRVGATDYPLGQVLATGAPAEGEYRYRRGDGSDAWVRIVGAPIRDVDGALVGGVVGIVDVDAERRLVEHQRLLMAELSHRVKNMLAVVQGIASATMRRSASLDDFSTAFEGRLQALSMAHTQLLRTDWRGAQLRGLLEAVLAPHAAGDRLSISGHDVALDARQGVALALVLHELATNAARHGALAAPDGHIAVSWQMQDFGDGLPRLHLRWAESGLPARPVISRNGLGMRLITRSVEGDLGGRIELQLGDHELAWAMDFGLQAEPEPGEED